MGFWHHPIWEVDTPVAYGEGAVALCRSHLARGLVFSLSGVVGSPPEAATTQPSGRRGSGARARRGAADHPPLPQDFGDGDGPGLFPRSFGFFVSAGGLPGTVVGAKVADGRGFGAGVSVGCALGGMGVGGLGFSAAAGSRGAGSGVSVGCALDGIVVGDVGVSEVGIGGRGVVVGSALGFTCGCGSTVSGSVGGGGGVEGGRSLG